MARKLSEILILKSASVSEGKELVNALLFSSDSYCLIPVVSTRKEIRETDESYYLPKPEFFRMIAKGQFVNYGKYAGEYYGYPIAETELIQEKKELESIMILTFLHTWRLKKDIHMQKVCTYYQHRKK